MKLTPLEYVRNLAIALDQGLNVVLMGFPDETLSARCGRLIHRSPYKYWAAVIDPIFRPFQGPNHCVNAHIKELARYHSAPERRKADE